MARLPAVAIRAAVVSALDASEVGYGEPLQRGARLVRYGRWALAATLTTDVVVACEVSEDGTGLATYAGPVEVIREIVPAALRVAWLAGRSVDRNLDP